MRRLAIFAAVAALALQGPGASAAAPAFGSFSYYMNSQGVDFSSCSEVSAAGQQQCGFWLTVDGDGAAATLTVTSPAYGGELVFRGPAVTVGGAYQFVGRTTSGPAGTARASLLESSNPYEVRLEGAYAVAID